MSSIHPFSQAGFWDFVARLNDRSKAQGQAVLPGNERAMGRPNRGRKGLGRRGRNAVAATEAPAAPLTQVDPIPYVSTSDEFNEKGLPPQYPSLPYSAEPAFPLDEKMATDAMPPTGGENRGVGPRGRGRGHGPRGNGAGDRRMRNVLFENEDALSEEEKAARAERRRLRREANGNGNGNGNGLSEEQKAVRAERRRLRREANGNGNGNGLSEEEKVARAERRRLRREANGRADGPGPNGRRMRRAFMQGQDVTMENSEFPQGENTQQFQQRRGGPNGPRRGRIAEAPGPRSMQPGSENLVDAQVSDEQNIGPRGQRGGLRGRGAARGVRGMNEARRARLEGIRGGPRKIAALVEQGAIPSNGRNANSGRGQGLGPRARQMAFRERAQAPGTECTQCGRGDGVLANPRQAKRQQMRWQMVNQPGAAPISSDDEPTSAATPRDVAANNMQGTRQVDGKPKRAGGKRNKKFKPQADVYDTEGAYIVHLPVPGASEKDIGVMWDTEKNVLRIAGIVQRPDIQQVGPEASMLRRQRPVGPFKRVVKFGGKKNDKVKVYENGISATLEDGILKVEVPKYDGDQTASDNEYVEVTPAY